MNRRRFLFTAAALVPSVRAGAARVTFSFDNAKLQAAWDGALAGLAANIKPVERFPRPVLWEGAGYGGVWLECAPLEGLVYAPVSLDAARANHDVFFELQRDDGYIPCYVWSNKTGTGQIQMVVPVAATAWELYGLTQDAAFLEKAYRACVRWDEWLARYRDTRRTGLCEAFCEYDTGHDNSPRFHGMPKACPDEDARVCPRVEGLPYLAPDLSATVYGGRVALAAMAREMGRPGEEARWLESAAAIRHAIMQRLYSPDDGAFYDLDARGRFVRVRGDAITRVVGEHVPDRRTFDRIWRLQLGNPKAFWSACPFPSIALDDPAFVHPIPRNSWGGAAQALTALRAPRWMEHYGKYADLARLMTRWVDALARAGRFLQQIDPETGAVTEDRGGYSPAMLVLFDFTRRLYGVMPEGGDLAWNCRLPQGAARCASTAATPGGEARLETTAAGSVLTLAGRAVLDVAGEARVVTLADGTPRRLVGTAGTRGTITLRRNGKRSSYALAPDQAIPL